MAYVDTISYSLDMLNCIFVNNSASLDGGVFFMAMSVGVTGSAAFTNSSFVTNQASEYGGVLFVLSSAPLISQDALLLNVSRCQFESNSATMSGSALYLSDGVGITVEDTTFSNNLGVCIYGSGSTLRLAMKRSSATNNRAVGFAGGVVSLAAFKSVVIENVIFRSNSAYLGGAVWLSTVNGEGEFIDISKSTTFIDNSAAEGGAMIIEGWGIKGLVSIVDAVFEHNVASVVAQGDSGRGGALILDHVQTANISHCRFNHNFGSLGSAIYSSSSLATTYITGTHLREAWKACDGSLRQTTLNVCIHPLIHC